MMMRPLPVFFGIGVRVVASCVCACLCLDLGPHEGRKEGRR